MIILRPGVIWCDTLCSKYLAIQQTKLNVPLGRLLGTPNEEVWPGVSQLRDWHDYPQWKSQNIARAVPGLHPSGVDLLEVIKSLPLFSSFEVSSGCPSHK